MRDAFEHCSQPIIVVLRGRVWIIGEKVAQPNGDVKNALNLPSFSADEVRWRVKPGKIGWR